MRKAIWALAGAAAILAGAFTAQRGLYGWNALARRGGSFWVETTLHDPNISSVADAAMRGARAQPRDLVWITRAPGFETADLWIDLGKAQDRIRLARVDPARWRFSVHVRPAGDRGPEEWRAALGAALVVNGSYFDQRGAPDTPLVSGGKRLGPASYNATHGAFVATEDGARIIDLRDGDWGAALAGARDGFVSYPMLIGEDGVGRATASRWLSARSFVGQDRAGRIVIGTTEDAGLTLDGLSDLLRRAPLDLQFALNLDGGPLACQSVAVGDFTRSHCGRGEFQVEGDRIMMLRPGFERQGWGLPIVLAVTAR